VIVVTVRAHFSLVLLLALAGQLAGQMRRGDEIASLKTAHVNGVELHYLDEGSGPPLILIHGGLGDYREWGAQMARFSARNRVIAYSRRYNYPNHNEPISPNHSAIIEAEDLAALIDLLKLERVDIVGYSYGAFTALYYATRHPERVRNLVLAEPPVLKWLRDIAGGNVELDRFMNAIWQPAAAAFRNNDPQAALRITCDYFGGKGSYDAMPPDGRRALTDNLREWKALTTSRDAFPSLDRDAVRKLNMSILLLSGEKTLPPLRLINEELIRLLPNAERVAVPNATHDMWIEKPEVCGETVRSFLDRH
jgi:non-heme chloroperoxidase